MTGAPTRVLADVIVHGKYARWWAELGRRETFEEAVARNFQMGLDRIEQLDRPARYRKRARAELAWAYQLVLKRQVLPSMRSLQFGGAPILRDHNRIFNCGFMQARRTNFFRELMFLLLGGSGIGYSVQRHHVDLLPPIHPYARWSRRRFVVQDSIIGWSDAVDALVRAYFAGEPYPVFDFRDVRPEGAILRTSGGKAPGPEPLRLALSRIDSVFRRAQADGNRLRPIHVHDIACHIADAVLSGGIRRAAMISLFSPDDPEMLHAKSGDWWFDALQRGRANNSAVLRRGRDERHFDTVFDALQASESGEPGIYWTDDREAGTNPCAEIALEDMQFCNLTTINASDVTDQQDLDARARAAAVIGTLQATFTDFHYLDPGWRRKTEFDALIGVSMTGIASGHVLNLDLTQAAHQANLANEYMAHLLGISPASRVTTVKPEGTASLVLGTSSGVHAWHDRYYVRRIRLNANEAIAQYLMQQLPYRETAVREELWPLEAEIGNPSNIVLSVPQAAPPDAITREEGALALLERVADVTRRWIRPGHHSGPNMNNVSTTVNVREGEWDAVRHWMFTNRDLYTGIALLPYDGGAYAQAPFESITEDQYHALAAHFTDIDVTQIDETADYTNLAGEAACAGGACEVTFA